MISQVHLPRQLARVLVDWYRRDARDLPWRRTDDPYAILVSEVMLQQTRVETVRERWVRFLERFPDLESLAAAGEDDVLAEWSGLGYYRRARSLHRLARRVVDEHGGALPTGVDELEELPGVGPYTAAAVGSIAFGRPALALDGNVARVLARLLALDDDPRRGPVARELHAHLAGWLEALPPGDVNQALMELGATVCLPRSPGCDECPLEDHCAARRLGIQERIPPGRHTPVEEVVEAGVVVEREGRYLLFRGQRPGVLQAMWEFPTLDSRLASVVGAEAPGTEAAGEGATGCSGAGGDATTEGATEAGVPAGDPVAGLAHYLEALGVPIRIHDALGEIRHGITTRRIRCRLYRGSLDGAASDALPLPSGRLGPAGAGAGATADLPRPEAGWFEPSEAAGIPLAASTRKVFEKVLEIDA